MGKRDALLEHAQALHLFLGPDPSVPDLIEILLSMRRPVHELL